MRGKCLMIQGTGSSVGKSILTSALLRILKQDGYSVAPFKAQNMALNSFVTREGLEMGRAQVVQAQAAGVTPSVMQNPILLKPTSDRRSQVIVGGKPIGTMSAMEYHRHKPALRSFVLKTYNELESMHDFIIIEGAGSPAEINLRDGDLVNMAMADIADAPVLLVGDINMGGVFAQLYGTAMLLTEAERKRVKGFVINKFRGDEKLLAPGLDMLYQKIPIPTLGVIPWMKLDIEDEDSQTEHFRTYGRQGTLKTCVVKLPHMSNFTDFLPLSLDEDLSFQYTTKREDIEACDILILPGSKNTIEDLQFIKNSGLEESIIRHGKAGKVLIGVCGGFQMLGQTLHDPLHTESSITTAAGLGLLDMETTFFADKQLTQTTMELTDSEFLPQAAGLMLDGYEIHQGQSVFGPRAVPLLYRKDGSVGGIGQADSKVIGTYLHGLFDSGHLMTHIKTLAGLQRTASPILSMESHRERAFDTLAQVVRQSLNMEAVMRILKGEAHG